MIIIAQNYKVLYKMSISKRKIYGIITIYVGYITKWFDAFHTTTRISIVVWKIGFIT